ncbi:MAG: recombinase family protein [Candidatus Promineifilaceae bacterium]
MSLQAAIYLRVSTDEQAEKFGLDVQNEKCRAMATVKGWPVAAAFVDEGISGTVDEKERPGLAALIAAAEAGQIKALIVAALDRLGRKTRLVLDLVDKLVCVWRGDRFLQRKPGHLNPGRAIRADDLRGPGPVGAGHDCGTNHGGKECSRPQRWGKRGTPASWVLPVRTWGAGG